jgi:flagellar basal body-associated protein FliL
LLIAISVGGGVATPWVVDQVRAGADDSEALASLTDDTPALVEFGEVTVNLNESRLNRYLRLKILLLVGDSSKTEVTRSMAEHQAVLKSWLLGYLADKSMEDIRGRTGQNRLKREIQMQFNSVMFPGGAPLIRNILFAEFNVQ